MPVMMINNVALFVGLPFFLIADEVTATLYVWQGGKKKCCEESLRETDWSFMKWYTWAPSYWRRLSIFLDVQLNLKLIGTRWMSASTHHGDAANTLCMLVFWWVGHKVEERDTWIRLQPSCCGLWFGLLYLKTWTTMIHKPAIIKENTWVLSQLRLWC